MLNFYLMLFFVLTHLILIIPMKKVINTQKVDNDFLFIYISNLIFLSAFIYFFILANSLFFSFFFGSFLMIFSYLFVYHLKNCLGKYQLLSLPYFVLCVYTFSHVFLLCLV